MKNWKYYILMLMNALVSGSCSDDLVQEPQDVDFCVRAAWQDGLSSGKATRALTATDILAGGTEDIVIGAKDYPTTINVHCSDNADFTLTNGSTVCDAHGEYWKYTPSIIYKDKKIERDNLTFIFSATIDDGDVLSGTANKDNITEKTGSGQRHMQITLHHTKALLRFAFKVSDKYDKVRYIRVTGIQLNDAPCTLVDKVLKTSEQFIAYCYIDPAVVTVSKENTIRCTYNIYDKDDATPDHLTREGVTATNQFTLSTLVSNGSPVGSISPGYYYDLHVTLNPDYLYVLSEHDNKQHLTIK